MRWRPSLSKTLIARCGDSFHESVVDGLKVFEFGSVALKTYLPDGDIDVGVYFRGSFDTLWIPSIMKILEKQEAIPKELPINVNSVDWIHAEVRRLTES